MKKLLFFFILLVFAACTATKSFYVFERTYTDRQDIVSDIYGSLNMFDIDSIPLNNWLYFKSIEEPNVGYFTQQTMSKQEDEKTQYYFIFTTFYKIDTTYEFKVRCRTSDKRLLNDR